MALKTLPEILDGSNKQFLLENPRKVAWFSEKNTPPYKSFEDFLNCHVGFLGLNPHGKNPITCQIYPIVYHRALGVDASEFLLVKIPWVKITTDHFFLVKTREDHGSDGDTPLSVPPESTSKTASIKDDGGTNERNMCDFMGKYGKFDGTCPPNRNIGLEEHPSIKKWVIVVGKRNLYMVGFPITRSLMATGNEPLGFQP